MESMSYWWSSYICLLTNCSMTKTYIVWSQICFIDYIMIQIDVYSPFYSDITRIDIKSTSVTAANAYFGNVSLVSHAKRTENQNLKKIIKNWQIKNDKISSQSRTINNGDLFRHSELFLKCYKMDFLSDKITFLSCQHISW